MRDVRMKKTALVVALLVLSSMFYLGLTDLPRTARATTFYVGGAGPSNYTKIQDAIDVAKPGDTVYVHGGTYYEHLTISKSLSLIGEYRDITTIDGNGAWDVIHVTGSSVNIIGFTLTNSGSESGDAAIEVSYTENCYIANNIIASNNFYGVFLHYSKNNTIVSNSIFSNKWTGIYLFHSTGSTIYGNDMVDDGIFIRGASLEHWNTHTIDESNTVNGKPVYYWKNISGGEVPLDAGQIILVNCVGMIVKNQNVTDGAGGIQLGFSSGNVFGYNNASANDNGITLYYSDNNSFLNNSVSWSNGLGISLFHSNNNTFTNNTSSWNLGSGITLQESNNNAIIGNNASSSSRWGFSLFHSNRNSISGNTASENKKGVYLESSEHNTITHNIFNRNQMHGIELQSSRNSFIANNTIRSNKVIGIGLYNSDSNTIYHNNIIENSDQAVDSRFNSWDIGYQSGGNYWSDYAGVDKRSGPDQDQPGSDGIGDTPYDIEGGGNRDRFPLTILAPPPWPPLAPAELKAIGDDRTVTLTWIPPSYNGTYPVTNYRIYRANASGQEVFLLEIGNVLNYSDVNLTNGQAYYYKVSAVNFVGEGPQSSEMTATPTTDPGPPTMLTATLSGEHLENVTLNWIPSADDGTGQNSIVGYWIHRNRTYDANGLGYELVTILPEATSEFVDNLTGEGDSDNCFYRICAVDLNGRMNCTRDQAAKFTRPLVQGPNLVSVPLIQSDDNLETVLQVVDFDNAWFYNSNSQEWKSFIRAKPYGGDFVNVNHTMALWIDVVSDTNLTVAGVVSFQTSIFLRAGWNLVGFPSFARNYTVADLKAYVPVKKVEGLDASAPPYYLRALQDSDELLAGHGYWVEVSEDAFWVITNE
jgi:parallel beta-helix repeat protein